jgi:hypothetical protein
MRFPYFSFIFSQYFQKELPGLYETDPDTLMHLSYQVKYNAKRMKKLEKDYTVMKTKEQEEQVELRVRQRKISEQFRIVISSFLRVSEIETGEQTIETKDRPAGKRIK